MTGSHAPTDRRAPVISSGRGHGLGNRLNHTATGGAMGRPRGGWARFDTRTEIAYLLFINLIDTRSSRYPILQ